MKAILPNCACVRAFAIFKPKYQTCQIRFHIIQLYGYNAKSVIFVRNVGLLQWLRDCENGYKNKDIYIRMWPDGKVSFYNMYDMAWEYLLTHTRARARIHWHIQLIHSPEIVKRNVYGSVHVPLNEVIR